MGNVYARLELTNDYDIFQADQGLRTVDDIRTLVVEQALMDTGASHLFLPRFMIERLGLPLLEEVDVETATGPATTRVYKGLQIAIGDRRTTLTCVELPGGTQPLIGVVVMEVLGIIPDVLRHTVTFVPKTGPSSFYSA